MLFKTLIALMYIFTTCNGYRILAIYPLFGKNHIQVLQAVAKALALKGHEVDVISHFPLQETVPNYRDIIKLETSENYPTISYQTMISAGEEEKEVRRKLKNMCDYLGHPELQQLIKDQQKNTTYDLVIVHYLSGYQCFSAIGYLLDLPVAAVVTTSLYSWMNRFVGEPLNLWLYPSSLHTWFSQNISFWSRLYNVILTHKDINAYNDIADEQQGYMEKYLGPGIPYFRDLEKRTSIILSNSHFSYHGIKPKTPAVIEIGGIHVTNGTGVINEDLKRFLDDSRDGFIYFSFGSMSLVETMPAEILQNFFSVFKKISPVRVVMRAPYPEALERNLSGNVLVQSWLPQQQILQHPNIRAFATHGGSLGTQEAVHYAVPMICVPLFADQHSNCDLLAYKNVALKLKIQTAQRKDYERVFDEILSKPIYKQAMSKLSTQYRDRPRSPSEEAVYWIEYVIRHGANALRSPAVDLAWWQIDLLDIYAFLLLCIIVAAGITTVTVKKLLGMLFNLKCAKKKVKLN